MGLSEIFATDAITFRWAIALVCRKMQWIYLLVCILAVPASALDNGLALTPPMGWMSWLYLGCGTDCRYNKTCLNEEFIKRTADRMIADGYKEAGYEYIVIDDCWLERKRNNGAMVPDRKRFKSGMKSLADYIHKRGLKFGMYEALSKTTCKNYPGIKGYETIDAATFASWKIDYLKVDACFVTQPEGLHGEFPDYPAFGRILNKTGRSILYSCSWPYYTRKQRTNLTAVKENCNIWRNYKDIQLNWNSIKSIMNWFGDRPDLYEYAGPGHFHDPDALVVGNPEITVNQARVQMAVWSILAAPLFISTDLDFIRPEYKEILLNKDIIAVNQDPLAQMGTRILKRNDLEVWTRVITTGMAIAFVNQNEEVVRAKYTHVELNVPDLDITVTDYFKEDDDQIFPEGGLFRVKVIGPGVKFYHFNISWDLTEDYEYVLNRLRFYTY